MWVLEENQTWNIEEESETSQNSICKPLLFLNNKDKAASGALPSPLGRCPCREIVAQGDAVEERRV